MIRRVREAFAERKNRATRDAVVVEAPATTWNLSALTPEYIESEHAQYAEAIAENLKKVDVLNIALSRNYGGGKSSILGRITEDHDGRVVELSLSKLSPIDNSEVDDSVPAQAGTPTNRIQQKIVKQLLYREEPKSARASRFRRIERFSWGRDRARPHGKRDRFDCLHDPGVGGDDRANAPTVP